MSCMTPEEVTGNPPPSLEELRAECITAWLEGYLEGQRKLDLADGPLRLHQVPYPKEGKIWQGAWFDDAGQQILVTYEINDDDVGEYSGSKTMADIATDTTNAAFEPLRDHGDEPDVDIEAMPRLEARDFLVLDNERRRQFLLEESEGQVDLANSFDSLEILVMLRHLVHAKGSEFEVTTTLDFENQVSLRLDEVETKYAEFSAARDEAMRRAVIQGNAPPGTPVRQSRVTMPPRRIRRGG